MTGLDHAPACACAVCRTFLLGAVTITQEDCETLACVWERWVSSDDGEAAALRAGRHGSPGSPRWIKLQAIATARKQRIPSAVESVTAPDIVALLERALDDARAGRLKALALAGLDADEHVTAYTFDDDQFGLRLSLVNATMLVAEQIASGTHEQVPL